MEKSAPTTNNRIGFRYFPDTLHYRESDLQIWLPELKSLGARWLVLEAPADRAIPENFIRGLQKAGIQPMLQMRLPLSEDTNPAELSTLFQAYSSWGVKYVCPLRPTKYPRSLGEWRLGSTKTGQPLP